MERLELWQVESLFNVYVEYTISKEYWLNVCFEIKKTDSDVGLGLLIDTWGKGEPVYLGASYSEAFEEFRKIVEEAVHD